MAIGRLVVTPSVITAIVMAVPAVTPPVIAVMTIGRLVVMTSVITAIVMAMSVVTLAIIAMSALAVVSIWTTRLAVCRRSNQLDDSSKHNSRDNKDYLSHFFLLTTVPCFSLRPRDTGDWVKFFPVSYNVDHKLPTIPKAIFLDHIVTSYFYKVKLPGQCIADNSNMADSSAPHHDLRLNVLVEA